MKSRVRFLKNYGFSESNIDGVGIILSTLLINYLREVFYGDRLTIKIGIGETSRTSVNLLYQLFSEDEQEVARAMTTMTFFDYTNRKVVKIPQLFKRMGDAAEIKDTTKFNYEGDHIYAFKPKPDRYMCFFFAGSKIIITNAFRKKQQKLPSNEKKKAENYKSDYIERDKRGKYYEKN